MKRAELFDRFVKPLLLPALAYLAASWLLRLALGAAGASTDWAVLLSNAVLIPLLILWNRHRNPEAGTKPIRLSAIPVWLLLSVGAALALTLLPQGREETQATFPAVAAYGLAAPITEELVYRGLILRGGERTAGKTAAFAASVLFFAVGHRPGWPMLAALLFGALLAGLLLRYGTLAAPIGVHVLVNLASFLPLRLAAPRIVSVTALVGVLAAVVFFCVKNAKEEPKEGDRDLPDKPENARRTR